MDKIPHLENVLQVAFKAGQVWKSQQQLILFLFFLNACLMRSEPNLDLELVTRAGNSQGAQ